MIIRKEQMAAFRQLALKSFEDRAAAHIRSEFSAETRGTDDQSLRSFIQTGILRAGKHRITREPDVGTFLDVMVLFGADFDESPRTRWAGEMLGDPGSSPQQKVEGLSQRLQAELSRRRTGLHV